MSLSNLCKPAFIYFVISSFLIVMGIFYKFQTSTLFAKIIFVLFWTWFLNFLCKQGKTNISWFLLILPYVVIILMSFITLEVVKKTGELL